ncbi:hypothetical protein FTX61_04405 [Nitriliruptoraceae bacterium ZYF776]|nr:hypothetical protein [Profundirhabdus halotolerans]
MRPAATWATTSDRPRGGGYAGPGPSGTPCRTPEEQEMKHSRMRAVGAITAVALLAAACGGGDDGGDAAPSGDGDTSEDGAAAADGGEGDPDPVTLSLVTSFPREAIEHAGLNLFLDNLEENAPWIEIDYRGASEVMEATMMGQSVASGAVDMASVPPAYYVEQFPLAGSFHLSTLSPSQEREAGVFDWVAERYREDFGVEYLGYVAAGIPFHLYLNDPIEAPEDLAGRQIRVVQTYRAMVEELGGSPVTMPGTEVYTAMERGVVDGFGWASVGVTFNGWDEVTDYEVDPGFYQMLLSLIINPNTWDGLDELTQEVITQTMIDSEPQIVELYEGLVAEERQARRDAGMELITLEGAAAEQLVDVAYEQGWADVESMTPDAAEFRERLDAAAR